MANVSVLVSRIKIDRVQANFDKSYFKQKLDNLSEFLQNSMQNILTRCAFAFIIFSLMNVPNLQFSETLRKLF